MNQGRRYEILSVIGRGGFGTVYRARLLAEGGFSKVVALKILNPDMAQVAEVAGRLRDEARVLGLVRHRAIVQADALVELDKRWTVVMEYVDGVDLKDVINAAKVPAGPALEISGEVAGALNAAYHAPGSDGAPLRLLHRDIKPANICVTPLGEVKVLDFGIARADFKGREAQTQSLAFGSPDYMAPERLEFNDGPEADMYALGVVLYEILTADRFGRASADENRHGRRVTKGLERLRADGVDEPVVELLGGLLAFDKDARPSAREVERQCAAIRRQVCGGLLRDWAEEVIPPLAAQRGEPNDDLMGSILVERTGSEVSSVLLGSAGWRSGRTPTPAPVGDAGAESGGGLGMVVMLAAVAIGFLAVVVLAGGAWIGWRALHPTEPVALVVPAGESSAPPATSVQTSPDPAGELAPEVAPEATAPATAEPTTEPAPATTEAPTPEPPPEAAAEPAEAPTPVSTERRSRTSNLGRVNVSGDAVSVRLVQGSHRYPPGPVPTGTFSVEATFPDHAPVVAGTVQVSAGQTVNLSCSAVFTRCTAR